MNSRTLFSILLKILALVIFRDLLVALPGLLNGLSFLLYNSEGVSTWFIIMQLLILVIFILQIYFLLFRTQSVIRFLGLPGEAEDQEGKFSINSSTIITMTVIILGGLILINALPEMILQVFIYFRKDNSPFASEKPGMVSLLTPFLKTIVGLLMVTSTRSIVQFIQKRSA